MKVVYYETRQDSKQVSYINYLDPMHNCGVIICMKSRGLLVKLVSLEKIAKIPDLKKNHYEPKLVGWPNMIKRKEKVGCWGWAHPVGLGPARQRR